MGTKKGQKRKTARRAYQVPKRTYGVVRTPKAPSQFRDIKGILNKRFGRGKNDE